MGMQIFCDLCGGPLKEKDRVPMGVGVPWDSAPQRAMTPMGIVEIPAHPPPEGHLFETFDLCRSCALMLCLQLKHRKTRIKYLPVIDNKPLDS